MEMRQYYYTSYVQHTTGQAGFQIKAMSPDISPALQGTIARLIDYRIPPDLNANAVETHPIALRYVSLESGESVLVCSQSSGQDEYHRPGNFFAHAIILNDRSPFTTAPPVFFWKSPFWRSEDSERRSEVASLPVLTSFEIEPALNVEKIRCFLAQEARYDWLYRLLCAVLQYGKTRKRLIILDTDEHIALWIAAVSYLLPPAYRPLLTFATYHHDLAHVSYLITGTTSRSQIHTILADAHSYFLLDTITGRVSPVEPSLYAWMVVQALRSNRSTNWLLPLLTTFEQRFPQPVAIDEQLNLLVLYTSLQLSPIEEEWSEKTHRAIQLALTSFSSRERLSAGDIDELCQIERHLREPVKQSQQSNVYDTYRKVFTLLKEHSSLIDEIILEELQPLAKQFSVLQPQERLSISLSIPYHLYGPQNIIHMIKGSVYLQWAEQSLPDAIRADLECLIALTGGDMTPEQIPQVRCMLKLLSAEEYLAVLKRCLPEYFLYAVSHEAHLNILHTLFPCGVQLMITEDFWRIYLNTLGELLQNTSTKEKALRILDFWFTTSPHDLPQGYPLQQFFLLLPTCALLQTDQFEEVDMHLSSASPRLWLSSVRFALVQQTAMMSGGSRARKKYPGNYLLALRQKLKISRQKAPLLMLPLLDTKIRRLFEVGHILEHHSQLTQLYKEFSAEHFWASYWKHFLRLLTTRDNESVLAVFSFWFEHAYEMLESTSSYIPQEFFLGVLSALRSATKRQRLNETLQDIDEKRQQKETAHSDGLYTWLPLITSLVRWERQ